MSVCTVDEIAFRKCDAKVAQGVQDVSAAGPVMLVKACLSIDPEAVDS
jgi:hypothetical protein